jgi:hypothetical protein
MSTERATPNGTTRHINVQAHDFYWCSAVETPDALQHAGDLYNLGRPMTADECRRPVHYGRMIDLMRPFTAAHYPGPIFGYVENGGPWDEHTSAASYIQPDEYNAVCWSFIMHGARGIMIFNHTFAPLGAPAGALSQDNFASTYYQTIQSGQSISIYDQAKATHARIDSLVRGGQLAERERFRVGQPGGEHVRGRGCRGALPGGHGRVHGARAALHVPVGDEYRGDVHDGGRLQRPGDGRWGVADGDGFGRRVLGHVRDRHDRPHLPVQPLRSGDV